MQKKITWYLCFVFAKTCSERTRSNSFKLKERRFRLDTWKKYFSQDGEAVAQAAQGSCRCPIPGGVQGVADGLFHSENHKIWLVIMLLLSLAAITWNHLWMSPRLPTASLVKINPLFPNFQATSSSACGMMDDFWLYTQLNILPLGKSLFWHS